MRVGIVTNTRSEKGLLADARIFARALESLGHESEILEYLEPGIAQGAGPRFHVLLFCEVLNALPDFRPLLLADGKIVHMTNPEWEMPNKLPLVQYVDFVLCKTEDALRGPWGNRARLTGFESEDLGRPDFSPLQFLHPAGGSCTRGTATVVRAWQRALSRGLPPEAQLHLVDPPPTGEARGKLRGVPQLSVHPRLNEIDFRSLQKRSAVHVLGSEYEGWGHLFWEAMGLGAHVLGTDGPWWKEARDAYTPVASVANGTRCLATQRAIDEASLSDAILEAARLPRAPVKQARERFEQARDGFRARFAGLMEEVAACRVG